jgi:hypothetical protein
MHTTTGTSTSTTPHTRFVPKNRVACSSQTPASSWTRSRPAPRPHLHATVPASLLAFRRTAGRRQPFLSVPVTPLTQDDSFAPKFARTLLTPRHCLPCPMVGRCLHFSLLVNPAHRGRRWRLFKSQTFPSDSLSPTASASTPTTPHGRREPVAFLVSRARRGASPLAVKVAGTARRHLLSSPCSLDAPEPPRSNAPSFSSQGAP